MLNLFYSTEILDFDGDFVYQDMEEEYTSKMVKRRRRIWKHLFRSTERNNLFPLANPGKLKKTNFVF